jgi:hypothetical protein
MALWQQEYLASVLASRLGFAVPEMRVIDYNYPEWGSLKSNLFTYARKYCDTGDLVKVVRVALFIILGDS